MKPCKRIEIVIEETLTRRVVELLESLEVPAYTLVPRASGRGDRGKRRADDPTGALTNAVFIIACDDAATVELIVEGVRPLLTRFGGVCLVSDAQWLRH